MTRVLAVANQKGGVGKTTTCVNLAGHLVSDHGALLALKGQYPHDELLELSRMNRLADRWEHRVSVLTVPGLEQHARHVVRLRKKPA